MAHELAHIQEHYEPYAEVVGNRRPVNPDSREYQSDDPETNAKFRVFRREGYGDAQGADLSDPPLVEARPGRRYLIVAV